MSPAAQLKFFAYDPAELLLERLTRDRDVLAKRLIDEGLVATPAGAVHLILEPVKDIVV
jgi:hypothetical protein